MILVDSSVWIDYFRKLDTPQTHRLRHISRARDILVADIVLYEILRGARDDLHARRLADELRQFGIVEIVSEAAAIKASEHDRKLRSLGFSVRKMADILIGTYCIEHGHHLLHNDRDFLPMFAHLGLQIY